MSVERQYGLNEVPGTEVAAPVRRDGVSAGFELEIRGILNRLAGRLDAMDSAFRAYRDSLYRLEGRLDRMPIPTAAEVMRNRQAEVSVAGYSASEAGAGRQSRGHDPSPPPMKPWELAGISKWTWYDRKRREKRRAAQEAGDE